VSDERNGGWQSPGDGPSDRPRYGEYAAPGEGQAAPVPPVVPSEAPPVGPPPGGWIAPPKPGLVPLRPLGFGTLLGAPFRVLRHSRAILGLALVLQLVVVVVGGGLLTAVIFGGLNRVTDFTDPEQQTLIAGSIGAAVVAALLTIVLNLVISVTLQGFVVVDVAGAVLGTKSTLRELWRRVRRYIWPLMAWSLLVFLAGILALAVIAGVVLLGTIGSNDGLIVSIPIAIVLGLGFFVLSVWVGVKVSLLPSTLVLERLRLWAALRRSWSLTGGHFWRTLGVQFLITVIISVVSQVVAVPLSLLPLLGFVVDPNGSTGAAAGISIVSSILSVVVSLIVGAITSIVISAAVALIYIDLRMRKEGLDLVLQAHAENPDSDDDPYAPGAA
jgi:membrane-anchored glycerophosphoryl diester phosphodiesterase (GDPDase)